MNMAHTHKHTISGTWVRPQRTLVIPCIIPHITYREHLQQADSFGMDVLQAAIRNSIIALKKTKYLYGNFSSPNI